MADHVSHFSHCFIILVLVAAAGNYMGLVQVDGSDICTQGLGTCSQLGDCDQKCQALHSDGEGSCDPTFNLCSCYYSCPSPPSPSPPKYCTIGLGLCTTECNEDCCKAKCARQYNQGAGYCNLFVGYYLCNCDYVC